MIHATITYNGKQASTLIESNDSFHVLTWAHRMGFNVIESCSTSAKLETDSGEKASLDWYYS